MQPKTKVSEVEAFIAHSGLKNLEKFSTQSKIVMLKRELQPLLSISKKAINGHIGLGMLADYECKYDECVSHFKTALTLGGINSFYGLKNYSKALRDSGRFSESNEYLLKALQANPNSELTFITINEISQLYLDEDLILDALKIFKGNQEFIDEVLEDSLLSSDSIYVDFVKEQKFDLDLYRQQLHLCLNASRSIFNDHINYNRRIDYENGYLSTVLGINAATPDLISQLNEQYIDSLIAFLETPNAVQKKYGNNIDKNVFYFSKFSNKQQIVEGFEVDATESV